MIVLLPKFCFFFLSTFSNFYHFQLCIAFYNIHELLLPFPFFVLFLFDM